jgi:hypothetical protein
MPGEIAANKRLEFYLKSAQIPGVTIRVATTIILVVKLNYPGNVSFADPAVTIINDEDFLIRKSFER